MRMEINIEKKRWLYRQSFIIQWMVFAAVLFFASLIANVLVDYLFDGGFAFPKTAKEIEGFLLSKFLKAVIIAGVIIFFIRNNQKKIEAKKG